ncbi:MAG: hypothetical protein RR177_00455 [Oscillospiraceae bacterium]
MKTSKRIRYIASMFSVIILFVCGFPLLSVADFGSDDIFIIENFDNIGAAGCWTGCDPKNPAPYIIVNEPDGIEGKGIEEKSDGGICFCNYLKRPIDISSYLDGNYAIKIKVYFDSFNWCDSEGDTAWRFEMTSLSGPDRSAYYWDNGAFLIKSGWNELYLPLIDSYKKIGLGNLNPSKINFIRLENKYSKCKHGVLDSISIVGFAPNEVVKNDNTLTIDSCDDQQGFISGSLSNEAKSGSGAIYGSSINRNKSVEIIRKWQTPFETGIVGKSGKLCFWMNISGVENIKDFKIGITSAGQSDSEEIYWTQKEMILKSGWNEYELDFKLAYENQGELKKFFNPSMMNYMRIFAAAAIPVLIGIDDIRIIGISPDGESSNIQQYYEDSRAVSGNEEDSPNKTISHGDYVPNNGEELITDRYAQSNEEAEMMAVKSQSDITWVFILLSAIVLVLVAAAVYFFLIRNPGEQETDTEDEHKSDKK